MAVAIRYMIQKEVFSAEDRVLVIASVTKPGRKKKPSFLVVSGNINNKCIKLAVSCSCFSSEQSWRLGGDNTCQECQRRRWERILQESQELEYWRVTLCWWSYVRQYRVWPHIWTHHIQVDSQQCIGQESIRDTTVQGMILCVCVCDYHSLYQHSQFTVYLVIIACIRAVSSQYI